VPAVGSPRRRHSTDL